MLVFHWLLAHVNKVRLIDILGLFTTALTPSLPLSPPPKRLINLYRPTTRANHVRVEWSRVKPREAEQGASHRSTN